MLKANVLNSFVPISRFNKGDANKIIEEVEEEGYKILVKNNTPKCVLVSTKEYQFLMEIVENYELLLEATKRLSTTDGKNISFEDVIKEYGISRKALDNMEDVELE